MTSKNRKTDDQNMLYHYSQKSILKDENEFSKELLKRLLLDLGKSIRRTDAMIAAITMNNGATLYTFDLKHFSSLKTLGLKLFP